MDPIFHRPKLALELAQLLLRPSSLETRIRSGLFISGPRQTGKSTFLVQDVIPTLEAAGGIVIYVDLWKAAGRTPAEKLTGVVRRKLEQLQDEGPQSIIDRAKVLLTHIGLSSAELEASVEPAHLVKTRLSGKLKFDFKPSAVGSAEGTDLSDALLALSGKTGRDIILIVDEVQDMIQDATGTLLMQELKAARDAINNQPGEHGYFLFVGNGSNRSMVHELTARRKSPFYGAQSMPFQPLGTDYADHVLEVIRRENPSAALPDRDTAHAGLRILGNRPNLFQEALAILQRTRGAGNHPDAVFEGIVNTLYDQEGKVEFERLQLLGALHQAVFARICRGPEQGVSGLYGSDALVEYARALELDKVTTREVQSALEDLKASGLVLRDGDRGPVLVADPFLREVWLRRYS